MYDIDLRLLPPLHQEASMPDSKETPKQQNQETLSLRITRELRKRLEKIREITASVTGEYVSTSEVAKQILESAHDPKLQDRLAVAQMLDDPTKSLLAIRSKCEAQRTLTRPEWTVLANYVMVGDEAQSSNHISPESAIAILKAFLAVHQLREGSSERDTYFLGYLLSPERGEENEYTAEKVREAVAYTIKQIEETDKRESLPLIARTLYVALDEDTSPLNRLNQALYPYWKSLWPIAARGHYFEQRRHKPIREAADPTHDIWNEAVIPSIQEGAFPLKSLSKCRMFFAATIAHNGASMTLLLLDYSIALLMIAWSPLKSRNRNTSITIARATRENAPCRSCVKKKLAAISAKSCRIFMFLMTC
jgi:hypothetical protein